MGAEALTYGESMREAGGWWRRKSTPAKVETYTRWSFHFFALIYVASIGLPVFGQVTGQLAVWLVLLVCVHAVVCAVTASRALDWTRGRREQPVRTLWVLGAVTLAISGAVIGIAERGPDDEGLDMATGAVFVGVLTFAAGIGALGVRRRRRVLALVGGFAAGAALGGFPWVTPSRSHWSRGWWCWSPPDSSPSPPPSPSGS